MFEIKNVTKKYAKEFALNDVSFNISKGLNFIIGASGSGKTTLLKIISGMDEFFDGEVNYKGKSIKSLAENEKSYFYNEVFGFVWQDFNLLEDYTVLENVMLPTHIANSGIDVNKILKQLKIFELATTKVKFLSGGQKQRVAIARELMKNPEVIIADEPTSALDEKSSKIIMDILRQISKTRTVIIVTHDTSFIYPNDNIYELDKGELISKKDCECIKSLPFKESKIIKLSFNKAINIAFNVGIKTKTGKFVISVLSVIIASLLLITTFSGTISKTGTGEFDSLLDTYGEALLDINIYSHFTSGIGTKPKDDTSDAQQSNPDVDVSQDIDGLFDMYFNDERVDFILYSESYMNVSFTFNGNNQKIESSNNVPEFMNLLYGRMPKLSGHEVIITEYAANLLGITKDNLNQKIEFEGETYNFSSGSPEIRKVKLKLTVVGVFDSTVKYLSNGEYITYSVNDAVFLSKDAIDEARKQAEIDGTDNNIKIRAKTPQDLISLKNEFNKNGIVPLGQFELIEDFVNLNAQTQEQTGSANIVITILALIMAVSIFLITAYMRRKEYAIYKICGYSNKNLNAINLSESLLLGIISATMLILSSPILNLFITKLFNFSILNGKMLMFAAFMCICLSIIYYFVFNIIMYSTNAQSVLKGGARQ